MTFLRLLVLLLLLAGFQCVAQAQPPSTPTPAPTPQVPKKTESFWQALAAFFGISSSPENQRGGQDEIESGRIYVVDLQVGNNSPILARDKYRSPIFLKDNQNILALKGEKIVRILATNGSVQELFTIPRIIKLVGLSKADGPEKILVMIRGDNCPIIGGLSLQSGEIMPIAYAGVEGDTDMISHLSGWNRVYNGGEPILEVRKQGTCLHERTDPPRCWTDVFLKLRDRDWANVSRCEGVNCSQPSLSSDFRKVVFIKDE